MTLRLPTPWRRLCTHSASSNATIAVLALGTGMVTAMFSAIDTVLWQPLPFDDPDRLVTLHETTANGARTRVALLTLDDWRTRGRGQSFASLAGYSARTYLATADTATAESFVASVAMTSGDLPAVLGVAILRGRMFSSRPHRCPHQTTPRTVRRIQRLRRHKLTAWQISQRVCVPRSTVSDWLRRSGMGRLQRR